MNAANSDTNSHFLDVPMGISAITDILITSPILLGSEGVNQSNNGGGG